MKVPEEYGGLGLSQVYYNRALMLVGTWHSSLVDAAVGAPVDRAGAAAAAVRLGGAEARVAAEGRSDAPVGLRADRARRGLRPRQGDDHRDARPRTARATCSTAASCGRPTGRVADVLVVMAKVPRSEGHKGGITAFIVPSDDRRRGRRAPHRVHGPARDRELPDPVRRRLRAGRERDRPRGHGPEDRPGHAEHRPPGAAGDLRRGRQVGDEDRPRVRQPSACSGASRSASTTRSRSGSRSSPRPPSAWRRCSTWPAGWPTRSATTSASRPRSPSSTAPRWAGGSSTSSCRCAAAAATRPPRRCRPAACAACRSSRRCATCASTASSRARRRSCTCSIAREAIDQHLQVAGDLLEPDVAARAQGEGARQGRRLLRHLVPEAGRRPRPGPTVICRVRRAGRAHAVRRARQPQARPLDVLRDGALAGRHREARQPSWAGSSTSAPSCSRSPRPSSTPRRRCASTPSGRPRPRSSPRPSAARRSLAPSGCSTSCGATPTTPNHRLALDVLKGRHTWLEEGIIDPSAGDGPMVPSAETDLGIATPIAARRRTGPSHEAPFTRPLTAGWSR